ncbi:PREDICTED: dentin sialophosphoprotein-like [Acropora digitifera]|uniref:dentin sialophosphoprotein-like n=1 Tax=Acropora digitifera TaxID=70779 RepID=UPI00077AD152|nr:PREDICTED: dentin sialophosphoprotein-like [Acropora digitifera]
MAATISSSRTSPGISNYPRYGITTGLVPKPPPLMPITGIRPIQDGRNVSSSLLSVSVAGAGGFPSSSSPKTFTPAPATTRGSVSPDKPPHFLPRSVVSPTASSQGTSPRGPPPLIRDLAISVTSAATGPDRDSDSTMRTRINQDIQPRHTLLQGSIVSDEAKGDSDIDEDREKKTSSPTPDLPSSTSERAAPSDTKTPPISGKYEIRSNLGTQTYTDSLRAGMSTDHLETIKSSTRTRPLEYSLMKYSSPPATGDREVSTSTCETQRLKSENLQVFSSSGLVHIGHQSGPLDEISQGSREVSRENSSESDIQLASNRLASDVEELDKELDLKDEVASANLSSTNLPSRNRAEFGHLPRHPHSYCGGSDSETLSPDESELLPESRDEMFVSQSTSRGGGENIEGAANDTGSVADTTAHAVLTIPCKSESEDRDAVTAFLQSTSIDLQGSATSTEPMLTHSSDSKRDTLFQNSQDTTAHEQDGDEVLNQEIQNEVCQASNRQVVSSRSICFGDAVGQDNSSEAIPALFGEDACDRPAKVRSSEQSEVGEKKADPVENEHFDPLEQTQDSPGNLPTSTDHTDTSPTEMSVDIIKNTAPVEVSETFHFTRETGLEVPFPDDASTWSSTSLAVKDRMASTVLDYGKQGSGGSNEAIHEADRYSSSRDSSPEISSAMDDVSENSENLSCPTFVGEFIPSLGAIDTPNTETLSEGEISPSKERSQSDDEPLCKDGNEAFGVMINKLAQKQQPVSRLEGLQPEIDSYQVNSQSKGMEDDDQLSEGEIPESDDEGDSNTTSSNQDTALETGCYIPISPAPPESPSHESESDRASPLPSWSSADNQYSSVMSLSLAARIPPFPYSTLSLNVGSASSSARSSPVPQAVTVNMGPESSPSSSSVMSRPQEPTPLLSDNYEPLSDDDVNDYDGLGISPVVAHNKDSV